MAGAERAPSERATALAIFHGVLYNEAALRKQLGSNAPTGEVSALLVALHQRFGAQFVDRLEGEFCVALVDPNRTPALRRHRSDRQLSDLLARGC